MPLRPKLSSHGLPDTGNADLADRLLYPGYARLARRIPARVHPNAITLAGLAAALAGAAVLATGAGAGQLVAVSLCILLWCVLDACDGIHARGSGQTSAFGGFLDHACDSLGLLALHIAMVYSFHITEPLLIASLLLRQTMFAAVFLVLAYTGRLNIPRLGFSTELYLYVLLFLGCALLASPAFPHSAQEVEALVGGTLKLYLVALPVGLVEIALISRKYFKQLEEFRV